jgi:hypothetical protein
MGKIHQVLYISILGVAQQGAHEEDDATMKSTKKYASRSR